MCHEPGSRPPQLPADLRRGGASPSALELESSDGAHLAAFLARAAAPVGTGIVVLPDIRGLTGFYDDLAVALADSGHDAIAIDSFGRHHGARMAPPGFDPMAAFGSVTADQVMLDATAAANHLRERVGVERVVTLGFCVGGRIAYLTATADSPIKPAGTIAFYGVLREWHPGMPRPIDRAGRMQGPILGLFGGADEVVSGEEVASFDHALGAAGVEHDFTIYPAAGHGFFDPASARFGAESEDAWRRVIAFLRRLSMAR